MATQTLSVTQLTSVIKRLLEMDPLLNRFQVKGEISNLKYHTSGHIYFTLKDIGAQISCVMFAGHRAGVSFRMENGQSIIASGRIGVYEKGGNYQMYVDKVGLDGVGSLYEEYEALKRKLEAEGLFDASLKKPIPKYAGRVGIVTASTGAAIQDICNISRRRNPYVQLVLYPAQVQGQGASATIVKGIKALDGKVDVIIVGRGGGSIEDLWAFNEEVTARAIFECKTPIISAVGHETDFTIADLVSDMRAPTPSAGAELAVYDINILDKSLAALHERLFEAMEGRIEYARNSVEKRSLRLKNLSPEKMLDKKKQWLVSCKSVLRKDFELIFNKKKSELLVMTRHMEGLNPLKKLESGFSYVTDEGGENITKTEQVKVGTEISIYVTDGVIDAEVKEVRKQ